jgi:hypothetical protein
VTPALIVDGRAVPVAYRVPGTVHREPRSPRDLPPVLRLVQRTTQRRHSGFIPMLLQGQITLSVKPVFAHRAQSGPSASRPPQDVVECGPSSTASSDASTLYLSAEIPAIGLVGADYVTPRLVARNDRYGCYDGREGAMAKRLMAAR